MLREIKAVHQEQGEGHRRWFESDGLDFVVWYDRSHAIVGFQLCYDLGAGEHALTWRPETGFAHSRVDSREDAPLRNLTPVLEPDSVVPWRAIAARFDERSRDLEAPLRQLVKTQLAHGAPRR
ncbi:hypothetical protein [Horticoccus sp. 23ND18S-11]|uniref:hypothetical protein n=1 Tax=Horticoccus sp. 23ND18S-11 TaxID=3391832 RepID=UPI0039C91C7A